MKKMRIISLVALIVLLISALGLGVYAAEAENKQLSVTVESTILIAGDDPVAISVSSGSVALVTSSDEKVITFDPTSGKLIPVGKGTATITVVNNLGTRATVDVKVYSSALSLGVETAALGMGIVFTVLIVIWGILAIFGKIATAGQKKSEMPAPVKAAPAPAPVAPVEAAPAASDEGELVAAITAAVALCMDAPIGSFRVVSFRKTNTKQAWNKK